MKSIFRLLIGLIIFTGCKQVQNVSDLITQPTPREVYERDFREGQPQMLQWKDAFEKAKTSRLEIELPFELHALSRSVNNSAIAYRLKLEEGERLLVDSYKPSDTVELFMDLFRFENDSTLSLDPVATKPYGKDKLEYEVNATDHYQLIIQSEIVDSLAYQIAIYTQPSYQFPVAGKGNKAIQSFWGAQRDGGKRSHEGVDVFADRGTPIIAVTKGIVSSTGDRGLGGKQVWLRDGIFGKSLYYAHLDSIAVSRGKRVAVGDTLGFVGNTGNARYTKPHLHFGIYSGRGAIDPLPFIKQRDIPELTSESLFSKAKTGLRQNQLRVGASTKYEKLATIPKDEPVEVLGKSSRWFHVRLNDSLEGFMHESLILPTN